MPTPVDSARAPAIAKLTRPKPYDALSRPRLYALLDEAAAGYPIVWVGAPPGAGKSTLVSDWIQARDRPNLWYQVDPGDAVLTPVGWWHHVEALDPSISVSLSGFRWPNAFPWYLPGRVRLGED